VDLSLHMKQTQTLSPQMLQSIKILQMGSQELLEYVEETIQENPALEIADTPPAEPLSTVIQKKLDWLEGADRFEKYSCRNTPGQEFDPLANLSQTPDTEESLYAYLLSQIQAMELPATQQAAAAYIIESLNGNGYLDDALEELAQEFHVQLTCLQQALHTVQQLEPPGVGARNLAECLSLQLDRKPEDTSLAQKIVDGHLDSLAKNQYAHIAKALSATQDAVRDACILIRSLNPKPGAGFAARETIHYIIPDLFVEFFPDHIEISSNNRFLPPLKLSSYYHSLLAETQDAEVKEYLTDKLRQAQWVIKSIDQRRSTLMRCAECILETQEAFFRSGDGHLVPMGLSDISAKLGVHESTVSRAIKGKYLQCPHGVFPLSHFLSRHLGSLSENGNLITPDAAKALLKKLIGEEDKKKPLSDQTLCAMMRAQGCPLSRRTVAKYRDELGIPPTTGRKEYE